MEIIERIYFVLKNLKFFNGYFPYLKRMRELRCKMKMGHRTLNPLVKNFVDNNTKPCFLYFPMSKTQSSVMCQLK